MSGVNKAILIGNLGSDPRVRHLENGVTVASFSIATTEVFKDKTTGERREQTEWHDISAWRRLGELAEKYLRKGSKVYVEGKIRSRKYVDKDGIERKAVEIIADEMTFLDRAAPGTEQAPRTTAAPAAGVAANTDRPQEDEVDDLPF